MCPAVAARLGKKVAVLDFVTPSPQGAAVLLVHTDQAVGVVIYSTEYMAIATAVPFSVSSHAEVAYTHSVGLYVHAR